MWSEEWNVSGNWQQCLLKDRSWRKNGGREEAGTRVRKSQQSPTQQQEKEEDAKGGDEEGVYKSNKEQNRQRLASKKKTKSYRNKNNINSNNKNNNYIKEKLHVDAFSFLYELAKKENKIEIFK